MSFFCIFRLAVSSNSSCSVNQKKVVVFFVIEIVICPNLIPNICTFVSAISYLLIWSWIEDCTLSTKIMMNNEFYWLAIFPYLSVRKYYQQSKLILIWMRGYKYQFSLKWTLKMVHTQLTLRVCNLKLSLKNHHCTER